MNFQYLVVAENYIHAASTKVKAEKLANLYVKRHRKSVSIFTNILTINRIVKPK